MYAKLLIGAGLLLALLLTGCNYGPYHTTARVGVHGYYDSAYDDFYFYPDVSVYFGIHSGLYYYRPHGSWIMVRTLPKDIHLHRDHRVELKRLPRDRPYENYRDHHDRYRRR